MRVGVVSEGPADFEVVRSVVKAVLELHGSDVHSIRPELQSDETDLNDPNGRRFSNWEIVRRECEERSSIKDYLDSGLDEAGLVVVHIDSAECDLPRYGVARPDRNAVDYVVACRAMVAEAMHGWLGGTCDPRIVEAVAVEETDAWLLPHYESSGRGAADTGSYVNVKERFTHALSKTNELTDKERKSLLRQQARPAYAALAKPLSKPKNLRACMAKNASLRLFVEALCAAATQLEAGSCRFDPTE